MSIVDKINNVLEETGLGKEDLRKVSKVRTSMQGFVGGKDIAEKGTDEELNLLIRWQDEIASLSNQAKDLKDSVSRLQKSIKKR